MELCLLVIAFPGLGIGHIQKVLNYGKHLYGSIRQCTYHKLSTRVELIQNFGYFFPLIGPDSS